MADTVSISLRTVAFVGMLQAAGVSIFLWLFGASLGKTASAVRSLGTGSALLAVFFTLAHHLIQPARMTGSFDGVFDGALQAMYLTTDAGTTNAVRILGLVMLVLGLSKQSRVAEAVSLIGATLVVVSYRQRLSHLLERQ